MPKVLESFSAKSQTDARTLAPVCDCCWLTGRCLQRATICGVLLLALLTCPLVVARCFAAVDADKVIHVTIKRVYKQSENGFCVVETNGGTYFICSFKKIADTVKGEKFLFTGNNSGVEAMLLENVGNEVDLVVANDFAGLIVQIRNMEGKAVDIVADAIGGE